MQYSVKHPSFAVLLFHFQRLFSPVFFSCFLLLRAFFFVFVCLLGKETCFLLHDVFASNDVELKKIQRIIAMRLSRLRCLGLYFVGVLTLDCVIGGMIVGVAFALMGRDGNPL